ncbi:MAG TPA: hypothetical protein VD908_19780, partial [Cytophagales bacterium]|nr:hypothetical protein [Cytophagales bacterium]
EFYVDVKKDRAHVEIFTINSRTYYVHKPNDDFLNPVNNGNDTIFTGEKNHLLKVKNGYRLLYKPTRSKKTRSIKLEESLKDERSVLRNKAYTFDLRLRIQKLENLMPDSSHPTDSGSVLTNSGKTYLNGIDINLPCSLYKKQVDKLGDSLTALLLKQDTLLQYFYPTSDSIEFLDSAIIHSMLSKASYYYVSSYSNDFLYQLSLKKPEYLINYLDGNPANKNEILNAIRDHYEYEAIIEKVKEVETRSVARKEVMKQKGKRVKGDILAATGITLLIAAEVTAMVLLGIWIF